MSPHELTARNGAVEIHVETQGGGHGAPLVLIAGLGSQLTWWPQGFLHTLVVAGHRVAVFDHRDTGRSTHLSGTVSLSAVRRAVAAREEPLLPYRIGDLAVDAVAVLDVVGAASAHLIGVSMGGTVAQELALTFPDRVATLTSIMASTGDPTVGRSTPIAEAVLFRAPPPDREGALAATVERRRVVGTPDTFDADEEYSRAAAAYDRSFHPAGAGRHLAALLAAGDRTARLRTLRVPTLVIHGSADPLIDVSGGRATADAVPGATYVEIPGMAHDLPERHWPTVLAPLLRHLDAR